jgi:hypothetical protein
MIVILIIAVAAELALLVVLIQIIVSLRRKHLGATRGDQSTARRTRASVASVKCNARFRNSDLFLSGGGRRIGLRP